MCLTAIFPPAWRIDRDEEIAGKRKTQKEYAEEFGVTERTIRTYLKEMEPDLEPEIPLF